MLINPRQKFDVGLVPYSIFDTNADISKILSRFISSNQDGDNLSFDSIASTVKLFNDNNRELTLELATVMYTSVNANLDFINIYLVPLYNNTLTNRIRTLKRIYTKFKLETGGRNLKEVVSEYIEKNKTTETKTITPMVARFDLMMLGDPRFDNDFEGHLKNIADHISDTIALYCYEQLLKADQLNYVTLNRDKLNVEKSFLLARKERIDNMFLALRQKRGLTVLGQRAIATMANNDSRCKPNRFVIPLTMMQLINTGDPSYSIYNEIGTEAYKKAFGNGAIPSIFGLALFGMPEEKMKDDFMYHGTSHTLYFTNGQLETNPAWTFTDDDRESRITLTLEDLLDKCPYFERGDIVEFKGIPGAGDANKNAYNESYKIFQTKYGMLNYYKQNYQKVLEEIAKSSVDIDNKIAQLTSSFNDVKTFINSGVGTLGSKREFSQAYVTYNIPVINQPENTISPSDATNLNIADIIILIRNNIYTSSIDYTNVKSSNIFVPNPKGVYFRLRSQTEIARDINQIAYGTLYDSLKSDFWSDQDTTATNIRGFYNKGRYGYREFGPDNYAPVTAIMTVEEIAKDFGFTLNRLFRGCMTHSALIMEGGVSTALSTTSNLIPNVEVNSRDGGMGQATFSTNVNCHIIEDNNIIVFMDQQPFGRLKGSAVDLIDKDGADTYRKQNGNFKYVEEAGAIFATPYLLSSNHKPMNTIDLCGRNPFQADNDKPQFPNADLQNIYNGVKRNYSKTVRDVNKHYAQVLSSGHTVFELKNGGKSHVYGTYFRTEEFVSDAGVLDRGFDQFGCVNMKGKT